MMDSEEPPLQVTPDAESHFWLMEDPPKSAITLRNTNQSALVFRIQSTKRQRYAFWPCAGIIQPKSTRAISTVLLEQGRQELIHSFTKLGAIAEFKERDQFAIEYCDADGLVLSGNEDEDHEVLLSFWNHVQNTEDIPMGRHTLRVRFSNCEGTTDRSSSQTSIVVPVSSPDRSFMSTQLPPSCVVSPSHSSDSEPDPHQMLNMEQLQSSDNEFGTLTHKYKELTVEKFILENKLGEQQNEYHQMTGGVVLKWQLQQTVRCGCCYHIFSHLHQSARAPVMSRTCRHSVCRGCVPSEDRIIDGVNHGKPCPLCRATHAFSKEAMVNESLCNVVALMSTS